LRQFTDEKLFRVAILETIRTVCICHDKGKDITAKWIYTPQVVSQLPMVSVDKSKLVCSSLIFVDTEVKSQWVHCVTKDSGLLFLTHNGDADGMDVFVV